MLFLLDALSYSGDDTEPTRAERAFEATLEVVASLAVALERSRIPVGLAVNGALQGRSDCLLPPGRGPYQLSGLLEMLARLTRGPNGNAGWFSARGIRVGGTTTCLYVCSRLTQERALAIEALRVSFRVPITVLHQEEATRQTIEHLAAAGIRTVPLPALAAGGAFNG